MTGNFKNLYTVLKNAPMWPEAKYLDYQWRYRMTPKEREIAREMGLRHYIMPTWWERVKAWFYQYLP